MTYLFLHQFSFVTTTTESESSKTKETNFENDDVSKMMKEDVSSQSIENINNKPVSTEKVKQKKMSKLMKNALITTKKSPDTLTIMNKKRKLSSIENVTFDAPVGSSSSSSSSSKLSSLLHVDTPSADANTNISTSVSVIREAVVEVDDSSSTSIVTSSGIVKTHSQPLAVGRVEPILSKNFPKPKVFDIEDFIALIP